MATSVVEKAKFSYKTLELPECSPVDVVRRKYRELALRLHPDKNLSDPQAVERFQAINIAYEALSNPEKKKAFDDALVLAQVSLSASADLQCAAALFQKHNPKRADDLNAFRMQRRAHSQHTLPRNSSQSADRPSQYTKEQTEFFRLREKEREREMKRKLEREREAQREQELERYRQQQEDRMKDEERRAREARQKQEKIEAALYLSRNATAQGNPDAGLGGSYGGGSLHSLRSMRRTHTGAGSRSGSCEPSSSPYAGQSGASTPRPVNAASSPTVCQPLRKDSGQMFHSPRTPNEGVDCCRVSPLAATSPVLADVLMNGDYSSNTGAETNLKTNIGATTSESSAALRLQRERERQLEVRRQEQEKYNARRLQEMKQHFQQRSQEALTEELMHFQREMRMLLDNETGERHQYLEQEEELERKVLAASMRRLVALHRLSQNVVSLSGEEAQVRLVLSNEEMFLRQLLELGFASEQMRDCVCKKESTEFFSLVSRAAASLASLQYYFHQRMTLVHEEHVRRDAVASEALLELRLLHLSTFAEPLARRDIQHTAALWWRTQVRRVLQEAPWIAEEARNRREWTYTESVERRKLVLFRSESLSRTSCCELELQECLVLMRKRGAHRQSVLSAALGETRDTIETLKMRHDAEVGKLLQELASAKEALAAARRELTLGQQERLGAAVRSLPALLAPQRNLSKGVSSPPTPHQQSVDRSPGYNSVVVSRLAPETTEVADICSLVNTESSGLTSPQIPATALVAGTAAPVTAVPAVTSSYYSTPVAGRKRTWTPSASSVTASVLPVASQTKFVKTPQLSATALPENSDRNPARRTPHDE